MPLNLKSQTYVSFKWKDQIEQFLCLCLCLGPATQNLYKTTVDPHFSDEEVECSINNFSGGYFTDGCIGGGVDIGTGQSHLPFSEVRLSDQYKEICASAMPGDTVLRDRDLTIPIPQEKTDHSTGHNILGFFRVLVQVRFATSKTKYDF